MKPTQILILILIASIVCSCKSEPVEPFELSVTDYDYSLAYSVLYKLTEKKLTITFCGELENERDSILYTTDDLPNKEIRELSKITDSWEYYILIPVLEMVTLKFTDSKKMELQNKYKLKIITKKI